MLQVLQFTARESHSFSLQVAQFLFCNPLVAFIPVLLLPVIFMIF